MYVHNGVITFPFSDHSLVYAVRKSQRLVKGPSRNIKARSYRTFDANSFINDLRQVPWNTIEVSDNPDLACSMFENLFIPICDNHAPFKQMKIPNKSPPWFNDEYLHLRKELESKKSKAHRTRSEQDWVAYKATRNRVNNLATKLKKEYFETSIKRSWHKFT